MLTEKLGQLNGGAYCGGAEDKHWMTAEYLRHCALFVTIVMIRFMIADTKGDHLTYSSDIA